MVTPHCAALEKLEAVYTGCDKVTSLNTFVHRNSSGTKSQKLAQVVFIRVWFIIGFCCGALDLFHPFCFLLFLPNS